MYGARRISYPLVHGLDEHRRGRSGERRADADSSIHAAEKDRAAEERREEERREIERLEERRRARRRRQRAPRRARPCPTVFYDDSEYPRVGPRPKALRGSIPKEPTT